MVRKILAWAKAHPAIAWPLIWIVALYVGSMVWAAHLAPSRLSPGQEIVLIGTGYEGDICVTWPQGFGLEPLFSFEKPGTRGTIMKDEGVRYVHLSIFGKPGAGMVERRYVAPAR